MQAWNTSISYMGLPNVNGRTWERYGPIIIGCTAAICAYVYALPFLAAADNGHWHLDALYASVFNISAAASAFLFAFYTYVRTAEGNVLREIRAAALFKRASGYMLRTVASTFVLAIISVPFLIVVPEPKDNHHVWYWAICVWVAFTAYVLAAICRSTYHFVAIMEAAYGDRLG